MNKFIVAFMIFGIASGLPRPEDDIIPTLEHTEIRDDFGQYSIAYSTADGSSITDHGALKSLDGGQSYVLARQGAYSYVSPNGEIIKVMYTADENGFQPVIENSPAPVLV